MYTVPDLTEVRLRQVVRNNCWILTDGVDGLKNSTSILAAMVIDLNKLVALVGIITILLFLRALGAHWMRFIMAHYRELLTLPSRINISLLWKSLLSILGIKSAAINELDLLRPNAN